MNPDRAGGTETVAELRAFLLGALPEGDAERVEYSLLSDDALYELLLATEEEVIDEYLRGTLSEAEASSLLGYLDRLPAGRAGIDFARELAQGLGSEEPSPAPWRRLLGATKRGAAKLRASRTPAWVGALGLAAVTLAIYISVALQDTGPLILNAGLTRGEGALPAASLSKIEDRLPVMLELGFSSHDRYRATLYDAESRAILTSPALEANEIEERILVPFSIPAEGLEPGDYSIVLNGETESGSFEPLERYVFRLTE